MIVEVGAGTDPDPRSSRLCDIVDLQGIDDVFDIRDPWPFKDSSVSGVIAKHVFEHISHDELATDVLPEIYRVLEPGGWVEFSVPLGGNQAIDPTHDANGQWAWATTDFFTGDKREYYYGHHEWDFELVDREMWVHAVAPYPANLPLGLLWRLVNRYNRDAACMLPCMVGELTVRWRAV